LLHPLLPLAGATATRLTSGVKVRAWQASIEVEHWKAVQGQSAAALLLMLIDQQASLASTRAPCHARLSEVRLKISELAKEASRQKLTFRQKCQQLRIRSGYSADIMLWKAFGGL
jgi:hypothetical protein